MKYLDDLKNELIEIGYTQQELDEMEIHDLIGLIELELNYYIQ